MNRRYTSSQKMNPSGCSWRQRSPKMTDIKNSKVTYGGFRRDQRYAYATVETLIVWTESTESNGTDMALSFQEAEGCAAIWLAWLADDPIILVGCCEFQADGLSHREFVSKAQQHLLTLGGPGKSLKLLLSVAQPFYRVLIYRMFI